METLLINEQFVFQFKYWRDGQIRIGMRFRNNLFESVSQFKQNQRPQAFDLAWQLTQAGREVIVTTSTAKYTVWANLKVQTVQNSQLLSSRLSLAPTLRPPEQSALELVLQPVLLA